MTVYSMHATPHGKFLTSSAGTFSGVSSNITGTQLMLNVIFAIPHRPIAQHSLAVIGRVLFRQPRKEIDQLVSTT